MSEQPVAKRKAEDELESEDVKTRATELTVAQKSTVPSAAVASADGGVAMQSGAAAAPPASSPGVATGAGAPATKNLFAKATAKLNLPTTGFGKKSSGFGGGGTGKSIFAKSKDGDSKDGTAAAGLGFHKYVKAGKISSGGATENNTFGKKASGDGNSIFNVKPQKLFVSGSKSSAQSAAQQRAGEVTDKFQNTETKSGEEGETKLHTVTQCKLYRFDRAEKAWKQAGSGQLTLNQASDKSSARLVLRQDVTKRVFLNAPVWAGTACQFENKGLRFAGINHIAGADPAVHIFLVQSKETKSLRPLADALLRLENVLKGAEGSSPKAATAAAAPVSSPPCQSAATSTTIVHLHVHASVVPGKVDEFVDLTTRNAKASLGEDGVVDFLVLQHHETSERLVIVESYKDAAAVAAHGETPHCNAWRTGTKPLCARSKAQWRSVGSEPCAQLLPNSAGKSVAVIVDVSVKPDKLSDAVANLTALADKCRSESGVSCRMLQQEEVFDGQKEALRILCVYPSTEAMTGHSATLDAFLAGLGDGKMGEASRSTFNVLP